MPCIHIYDSSKFQNAHEAFEKNGLSKNSHHVCSDAKAMDSLDDLYELLKLICEAANNPNLLFAVSASHTYVDFTDIEAKITKLKNNQEWDRINDDLNLEDLAALCVSDSLLESKKQRTSNLAFSTLKYFTACSDNVAPNLETFSSISNEGDSLVIKDDCSTPNASLEFNLNTGALSVATEKGSINNVHSKFDSVVMSIEHKNGLISAKFHFFGDEVSRSIFDKSHSDIIQFEIDLDTMSISTVIKMDTAQLISKGESCLKQIIKTVHQKKPCIKFDLVRHGEIA